MSLMEDAIADRTQRRRLMRRPVSRTRGWIIAGLVICVAFAGWMAWMVLHKIDALTTANSDNLQWSLAQADVEFLRFRLALEESGADPAKLADVRRAFDIFYSRVSTIESGEVFRTLRDDPRFAGPRIRVSAFLDATVPLIDGPDAALLAAADQLKAQAIPIGGDVRALSLSALAAFAELSDDRRQSVLELLAGLAAVLALLFVVMGLLATSHFRLFRLADRRADQVEAASARMRTIVETSPHAIVVSDDVGTIREFNPAAERIFGHTRAEARGRNMLELLVPAKDLAARRTGEFAFIDARRRPLRKERHFEIVAQDRDGRSFDAEFAIDRVEADKPIYVSHIRDISRRKSAEDELLKARDQALAGERVKSEFLAVMSHEMRTPLNGLLGTMQLLNDHHLTERQTGLLSRMEASGRMLLGLVNDVLDLAKYEAGMMRTEQEPLSPERLLSGVAETAAPLAQSYGNSLDWHWVGAAPAQALGDVRRLRQVLLNLVGNAVKFTRDGSVEMEGEYLNATEVEFRVIDNGIGIAAEDLDRIFQDFETLDSSYAREAGGTGLGLGISRRLVQLMGGEIGVESEVGEGSLFWVRLPLVPVLGDAAAQDLEIVKAPRPDRALDLLLVEDNEINRFIAREMLQGDGHHVVEAENGQAGVDYAALRRFDAILMDVSMPVMDGIEATQRIRSGGQASADTPVIALTAHALPEDRARFRDMGMAACVSKPIDRNQLLRSLAEVIQGGRPTDVAPPAPDDTRLLDDDLLAVFLSKVPPQDAQRLVTRFLNETEADVMALAEADPSDPDILPVAHKCAGSCGTFGAEALRAALSRIQTGIKMGTQVGPEQLAALAPLWNDSRAAIEARTEGLNPSGAPAREASQ